LSSARRQTIFDEVSDETAEFGFRFRFEPQAVQRDPDLAFVITRRRRTRPPLFDFRRIGPLNEHTNEQLDVLCQADATIARQHIADKRYVELSVGRCGCRRSISIVDTADTSVETNRFVER
jgi:hypothetical protein